MAVDEASLTEVGERFLGALGRRDFEAVGACFAAEAQLRAIVPPGIREDEGAEAIAARFERWFGETGELVDSSTDAVQDILRLRYVVRESDPASGPTVFEQTAYAEVAGGVITKMRVACSGERPLA
jgi:hypothetical protein